MAAICIANNRLGNLAIHQISHPKEIAKTQQRNHEKENKIRRWRVGITCSGMAQQINRKPVFYIFQKIDFFGYRIEPFTGIHAKAAFVKMRISNGTGISTRFQTRRFG
ncbi:MAG: hypothetical protein R3C26_21615 [Calditrichia bacterium]